MARCTGSGPIADSRKPAKAITQVNQRIGPEPITKWILSLHAPADYRVVHSGCFPAGDRGTRIA